MVSNARLNSPTILLRESVGNCAHGALSGSLPSLVRGRGGTAVSLRTHGSSDHSLLASRSFLSYVTTETTRSNASEHTVGMYIFGEPVGLLGT